MLLVLSLSGFTIAYSNSLLQGHLYTEPGIAINLIFFVLIYSVPQFTNHRKKSQIEIIKYLRLQMGNAAVIYLNNPPMCNCSFLYGKKETLANGKGNVYNHY